MAKTKNKPLKCCHPNCFECPYDDCKYDRLETQDYDSSKCLDLEILGRNKNYIQANIQDIRCRRNSVVRGNRKYYDRHEYNKKYYSEHKEEIKEYVKSKYNTKDNTEKCRAYVKSHSKVVQTYQKSYYERHKEELKIKAKERYYERIKSKT